MMKVLGKDGKFVSIFKERPFGVVNLSTFKMTTYFILPYFWGADEIFWSPCWVSVSATKLETDFLP